MVVPQTWLFEAENGETYVTTIFNDWYVDVLMEHRAEFLVSACGEGRVADESR